MADGPSGVGGVWSRVASAYDAVTSYSRAALTAGAATYLMLAQDAAQVPTPSEQDVTEANRRRAKWQLPDTTSGPNVPPPLPSTGGVSLRGGAIGVARTVNPVLAAGAEAVSTVVTRPLTQAIVNAGNIVANAAHDANAAATTARATRGDREVGRRGGPSGGEPVPGRVPDPLLKRDVDMNAAIEACRKEIAGLNQAQRENIGMRTAADIENHFNGNVGAIHSRYAEIAGNPAKTASIERLTNMASQRATYFPAGFRVQARILDNGDVALRFVRGSTERPAPTFPWRAPT